MISESNYRDTARILKEWTAAYISHTAVGGIVRRIGEVQAEADKKIVEDLEVSASLPEGKQVDLLYAEADGVYVRGTTKKKHCKVCHGIIYEGLDKNGSRVSLRDQKVAMTTQPTDGFWQEGSKH